MASISTQQVMKTALRHSGICRALLDRDGMTVALAYCASQHVAPPLCAGGAQSAREQMAALLQDYGWWAKHLKLRHVRAVWRERSLAQAARRKRPRMC